MPLAHPTVKCDARMPDLVLSNRLRRRRGFFLILFGTRNVVSDEGEPIQAVCPNCSKQAYFQNKSVRNWFTIFYVPLIPIGAKWTLCQCSNCGTRFRTSAQQLQHHASANQQQQMQQAIQMYNSLRASPANSVTLNQLMLLYLQLREYDQAISAANEFSQALNASEQCMSTLGRVLLEQGRHVDAIKWFDAALARNSMLGEAAYFKALALMNQTPPDLPAATAAARTARTAGLDGADALLREIENRSRAATA